MTREELLLHVMDTLRRADFDMSDEMQAHFLAFDLMARRDSTLLIVKVLANVDSLRPFVARDLGVLAEFLDGQALLIARRSGKGILFDGVVYTRHTIPLITTATLHSMFVEGVPPIIFSSPGGLFVKVDPGMIRELRARKGISLGRLATMVGVSRKTISQYEEGMCPSVEVAGRLEEALGEPIVLAIDPLSYCPPSTGDIALSGIDLKGRAEEAMDLLSSLGYEVVPLARCPFNAFSRDRVSLFLTGVSGAGLADRRKARQLSQISRFVDREAFLVVERSADDTFEGNPVIRFRELQLMECTEDVKDLVAERAKAPGK
ncbi:MAG: transcriptional regulator [Thermoplasmata archaeon]|nr:transcriptional regulator [Thermoplasmata archaeon]